MIEATEMIIPGFCGFGIRFCLDGFRLIYTLIAVLMWSVSGIFSREYMAHYSKKKRYYLFFWITFLATIGVFLSADLYTTFIFFEIMSLTSYVWVAFDEKKESLRAAETYLAVAIIGGMVMLMGLFLLYHDLGTVKIDEIWAAAVWAAETGHKDRLYIAGALLLFGFGAKAGCFPLHIWLPKAHPVAPAPASALLSGILTKTGIFGIIVISTRIFGNDGFWGIFLTGLGLITMFLGACLALFSINLKRTLACSSVSQIGFILTGTGMAVLLSYAGENSAIAARGAFLHMVNHSLFKLVLFLCAGTVFMNLHQLDLNEIRGFGRKKPLLAFCFLMGALGISGIPGWSGYISKTLIHESMVEYQKAVAEGIAGAGNLVQAGSRFVRSREFSFAAKLLDNPGFWSAAEWIFLITGGMTFAYMLKLFFALFVEKHPKRQKEFDDMSGSYIKKSSAAAMAFPAVLLPLMGFFPAITMNRLADFGEGFFLSRGMEHSVHYFHFNNLKGGLISIGIGIFLYGVIVRQWLIKESVYIDRWPKGMDLENLLYRPVLQNLLPGVFGMIFSLLDKYLISVIVKLFLEISSFFCRIMDHMADGIILLARKTTHRQLGEPKSSAEKNQFARKIGKILDIWAELKFFFQKKRNKDKHLEKLVSHIPELIRKEEEIIKVGCLVEESFSFGLMLFCIGLFLTLGYLLFHFFGG